LKTKLFTSLVLAILMFSAMSIGVVKAQDTTTVADQFEITLLAPNTNPARNAWSSLIFEELKKIGIETDLFQAGWDIVGPRTFAYEADENGIPTWDEGGYDIFFVGLSGALEYDPTDSYCSCSYSPSGGNFAWYENSEVDTLLSAYTSELDAVARAAIAKDLQAHFAEDLPYISIANTAGLWAHSDALDWTDEEFLFLSTTNFADGWKDLTGPSSLVYAHSYELTEFSPFVIQSYIAAAYLNPILPGLFERDVNDANYAYKPMLASALTWNTEKTEATVDLRTDVKFSDGTFMDADDVVNTYRLHMTPATGSTSYATLDTFLDTAGKGNNTVEKVDADTVKFYFKDPYFLAESIMALGIMPESVLGNYLTPAQADYDYNSDPATYLVGAGPYKYSDHDPTNNNFKIEAVTGYWGGDVGMDEVLFNKYGNKEAAIAALEGGDVDVIDAQFVVDAAEVEDIAGVDYVAITDFGTQFMTVNMLHPIVGTGVDTPLGKEDPTKAADAAKYVRQAISHMVPRETIVDTILKGVGSIGTSLWPDAAAGYDDSLVPDAYSLTTAMDLMKQAGYFAEEDETSDSDVSPLANFLFMAFSAFALSAIVMKKRSN
jgi:ABC-type transport system substrate-binding protein